MIELKNIEDQIAFKCGVKGYQFPEIQKDDWCLLVIEVRQSNQVFTKTDPAIDAKELLAIYEWFKCLSEKKLPRYAELTFTEPCISFQFLAYRNEKVRIAIRLSHELEPDFEILQFRSESSNWTIVFELDGSNFSEILSGLESAIILFPARGESEYSS